MKKLKKLNKAKLAFDMLEKEMSVINSPEELKGYVGGYGDSTGSTGSTGGSGSTSGSNAVTYLPNGYCLFNAISYILTGSTNSAGAFVSNFESQYGTGAAKEDSSGQLLGYEMTGKQMLQLLRSTPGYSAGFIGAGSIPASEFSDGGKVMGIISSTGPNGESLMHAVEFTHKNADGSYGYYDPTSGETLDNFNGQINMAFTADPQAW